MHMFKLFVAAFVTLAVAWPAVAHGASARTCDIHGKERKLGATYVTSLKATGVSCASESSAVSWSRVSRFPRSANSSSRHR